MLCEVKTMTQITRWSVVPIAMALWLGVSAAGQSQSVTSISSNSAPVQLSGMSGGNRKDDSCAGYIAANPNHVVKLTEATDLRFSLQSKGQPALLIRSSYGQEFCVPADSYSNGKVEIPGRWKQGTYSVFVGDRANGSHAYTLLISPS
jgi:hypothetical protein